MKRKRASGERKDASVRRKPRLAPGCRLAGDSRRGSRVLYCPSGAVQLNSLATEVLALCDGRRTRDQIVARMLAASRRSLAHNVREFLTAAYRHGWVVNRR